MRHPGMIVSLITNLIFLAGPSSSNRDYHFGSARFAHEMWINNKAVFKKPVEVDVEFVTPGAFDWVIVDENGKEVRTIRSNNEHGGWTSINFASLGLFADYSGGFRNASSGGREVSKAMCI